MFIDLWIQKREWHCKPNKGPIHFKLSSWTLQKAKEVCQENQHCKAVNDYACDNVTISLCLNDSKLKQDANRLSSGRVDCLYEKSGNVIFYLNTSGFSLYS